MQDIKEQIHEVKEEIQGDISKVDEHVGELNKTLLDVAGKLTGSYEELLKQQEKNNEQDKVLGKHNLWLWVHSFLLGILFIFFISSL